MSRAWIAALALGAGLVAAAAVGATPGDDSLEGRLRAQLAAERVSHREQVRDLRVTISQRDYTHRRQVAGLRRTIRQRPSAQHATRIAATLYSIPYRTLDAVAGCESERNPRAIGQRPIWNGERAEGYMQIIPSTFRAQTTLGAAGMDPFDVYVNVLAAAQIMDADRARGLDLLRQWDCGADGIPKSSRRAG